jgi:hypothetical protein
MPEEARPVRLARPGGAPPRPVQVPRGAGAGAGPATGPRDGTQRRPNVGATRRAIRLSLLFVAGIVVVYAALVALARAGPYAGSSGTAAELEIVGSAAVLIGAIGIVAALGTAPRAVELGDRATVVVGRFGRRYRFPGPGELRVTVLQRFPAGPLTPVPLVSVELAGGSSRRSFLLEEHLLDPAPPGGLQATAG